jgi:hypothetical protein
MAHDAGLSSRLAPLVLMMLMLLLPRPRRSPLYHIFRSPSPRRLHHVAFTTSPSPCPTRRSTSPYLLAIAHCLDWHTTWPGSVWPTTPCPSLCHSFNLITNPQPNLVACHLPFSLLTARQPPSPRQPHVHVPHLGLCGRSRAASQGAQRNRGRPGPGPRPGEPRAADEGQGGEAREGTGGTGRVVSPRRCRRRRGHGIGIGGTTGMVWRRRARRRRDGSGGRDGFAGRAEIGFVNQGEGDMWSDGGGSMGC